MIVPPQAKGVIMICVRFRQLKNTLKVFSLALIWSLVLSVVNEANANYDGTDQVNLRTESAPTMIEAKSPYYALYNNTAYCTYGAVQGAWHSTVDVTKKTFETIVWAVFEPVSAIEVVFSVHEIASYEWGSLPNRINDFLVRLAHLPPERQWEFTCRVASVVGVGSLLAYLSSGIASPAMMEALGVVLADFAIALGEATMIGHEALELSHLLQTAVAANAQVMPYVPKVQLEIAEELVGVLEEFEERSSEVGASE